VACSFLVVGVMQYSSRPVASGGRPHNNKSTMNVDGRPLLATNVDGRPLLATDAMLVAVSCCQHSRATIADQRSSLDLADAENLRYYRGPYSVPCWSDKVSEETLNIEFRTL
jgi:hypothetical protein